VSQRILATTEGVAETVIIFLSSSLITVCHTVCEGAWWRFQNLWCWSPTPLGEIMPDLLKHAPPSHVTIQNLDSLCQTAWT